MIPPKSLYCPNTILILVSGEILLQIQICPISILSSNLMFYGIAAAPGNKLRFPKCWRWRSCGRPLIVIWLFLDTTTFYWGDLLRSIPFVTVWKIGLRDQIHLENTFKEQSLRLLTFDTFDGGHEETWPDQQKDNDKDKCKDKDNDNDI